MTAFAKGSGSPPTHKTTVVNGGGAAAGEGDHPHNQCKNSPSDTVNSYYFLPRGHRSVSVQVDSVFGLHLVTHEDGMYEIKRMEGRSHRLRSVILICLVLAVSGIIGFGYFCNDQVCALTKREVIIGNSDIAALTSEYGGASASSNAGVVAGGRAAQQQQQRRQAKGVPREMSFYEAANTVYQQQQQLANPGLSYEEVLNEDFQFDIDAHDVMVFLHIQKTGGTSFGRHLVQDLDLKRPCTCQRKKKRCHCFRSHRNENWLFSRYSTGWKCGLHADWTELTSCVDPELDKNEGETAKRRYFYITLLREPIARYLSEFRHVQRGATWKNSRHWCLGRQATGDELPPCYTGENWNGVALDDFAGCESNLAANRQTRMLSDLALVGCYNKTYMSPAERDRVMLASAKRNLAGMAYFGLTEFQKLSQYIFEETFNLRFAIPFEQHNSTVSSATMSGLTADQRKRIEQLNALDIELYEFAKRMLFKRFEKLKAKDADFEVRYAHLGNLGVRNGGVGTEFNWDSNLDESNTEQQQQHRTQQQQRQH